jgi:hypothetical protein
MSLLSDFYLAENDDEARRYKDSQKPFGDREQFTSLTDLKISTLWAGMQGVEWDIETHQLLTVFEKPAGPWIWRFPAPLAKELAETTPEKVLQVAAQWSATDEMACSPSDVVPIIEALAGLAKKASDTKRNLYFWLSL